MSESVIRYARRDDGIVVLTIDDPAARVNTLNPALEESLAEVVDRLEAERDSITGVVLVSGKSTFIVGADVNRFQRLTSNDAPQVFLEIEALKDSLRRLERLGRPVVAALEGVALGGGFEVALACHRRMALADSGVRVGLPEVTLGLLPGGGGLTRVVRMFGLEKALTEVLWPGRRFTVEQALEVGLIDEIVEGPEVLPAAIAWILAHREDPEAAMQPWDRPDYRMPGGSPVDPEMAVRLPGLSAALRKRVPCSRYAAPRAILSAAVEGAQVDVDTSSRIETRYFVSLATSPEAQAQVSVVFFDDLAVRTRRRAGEVHERVGAFVARLRTAYEQAAGELVASGVAPLVVRRAAAAAGLTIEPEVPLDGETGSAAGGLGVSGLTADGLAAGEIEDRLLRAVAEAALAGLAAGDVPDPATANVESVQAGFPAWTGGAVRYRG